MKKAKFNWKKVVFPVFCIALLVIVGSMYQKMKELTNQLAYLQDSTNVILSDMSGLQSNIEKTLAEEASMIEDYSITINSFDFAHETYRVDISVMPKEYTDRTQISIYFGTLECQLQQGRYAYTGSVNLPLEKSFDGNITFLLSNGKKKMTEVLTDYRGLELDLKEVLSATLEDAPTYRNGELRLTSNCDVMLDGINQFEFERLDMVTMLDNTRIGVQDLLTPLVSLDDVDSMTDIDGETIQGTEEATISQHTVSAVSGISGRTECEFVYEMPEEDSQEQEDSAQDPETRHIRIFVYAKTTEGYRFECTVFEGDYLIREQTMDKDSFRWNTKNAAYDRNGNELNLD